MGELAALILVLVALPVANAHLARPLTDYTTEVLGRIGWWIDITLRIVVHVGLVVLCAFVTRPWWRALGLPSTRSARRAALALAALSAGVVVMTIFRWSSGGSFIDVPGGPRTFAETMAYQVRGLVVGSAQEVLYRAFALGVMCRRRLPFLISAAISTAGFVYYHMPDPQLVGLVVTSLGALAVYAGTRNVAAAALAHAALGTIL